MEQGVVIKNMNGYFYVQTPNGDVHECKVRGRLKKERYSLLVGDHEEILCVDQPLPILTKSL